MNTLKQLIDNKIIKIIPYNNNLKLEANTIIPYYKKSFINVQNNNTLNNIIDSTNKNTINEQNENTITNKQNENTINEQHENTITNEQNENTMSKQNENTINEHITNIVNNTITNIKYHFIDTTIYNSFDLVNREIIKCYNKTPDIIVIGKVNNIKIDVIPLYPILYNDIYYITPIQLEQINGYAFNIIDRIADYLGAIISDLSFKFNNNKIDIYDINQYGLSTFRQGIEHNAVVHKIESWMTRYVYKNITGWMTNKNKLAINYIFKYYIINNIVELGSYFGKSTVYMAHKKSNMNIYCFDNFTNVMKKHSTLTKITPMDTNYFLKYLRYETFNANLNFYNSIPLIPYNNIQTKLQNGNIYTIKFDNYNAIDFLQKNNIFNIDLFYIDFCKIDNEIIKLVDAILLLYPNSIIIGDDARYLKKAVEYIEKKYNVINLSDCYICCKIELINRNELLNIYETLLQYESTTNINKLVTLSMEYRINYIMRSCEKQNEINKIKYDIVYLNVNLNQYSEYIGGNIYHFICKLQLDNKFTKYCKQLYKELTKIQPDKQILNNYGLRPLDYIKYNIAFI